MRDIQPSVPTPALESLLAEREWVRGLARRLVRDEARADDLEQQAWLAALERPPADARSPRGWLGTVLRRAAGRERRDDYRRDRRQHGAARPESLPATADVVAQAETHGRVVQAVLALEEPYRTTLLLRFFEDLPPRDVAARMGVPVETARSRAQRGLARLREKFDAEHRGDRRAWAVPLLDLALRARPGAPGPDPWDAPDARPPAAPPVSAPPLPASVPIAPSVGSRVALVLGGLGLAVGAVLWLALDSGRVPRPAAAPGARSEETAAAPSDAGGRLEAQPALASGSAARTGTRAGAATVAGRVTREADGSPVAGARVVVIALEPVTFADPLETVSDADGRYTLRGVPAGEAMLVASAPGLVARGSAAARPHGYNPLAFLVPPGGALARDVSLVPAAVARGRVVHADGRPAAGAVVRATPAWDSVDAAESHALPSETTRVSSDGSWSLLSLAPDTPYEIEASAEGRCPCRVGPLRTEGCRALEVDLRFAAPRHVDVLVVEAKTGRPLPQASVYVDARAPDGSSRPVPGSWPSGEDGRVRVGPLPEGTLWVRAQVASRGSQGFTSSTALVAPQEDRARVEMRAFVVDEGARGPREGPGTLRVHAVGPGGEDVPLAVATSWVFARSGGALSTATVREGKADLGWSSSPKEFVDVYRPRGADGAPLPLGAGHVAVAGATEVLVRLAPERAIAGTVVGPDGHGVAGALVVARPAQWPDAMAQYGGGHGHGRTDASGAFRVGGLGDEDYLLSVDPPPDFAAFRSDPLPAGTTDAVLRLAAAAAVSVSVVDGVGRPVQGARVVVQRVASGAAGLFGWPVAEEGPRLEAATDALGSTLLLGLDRRSPYVLAVDPPPGREDLGARRSSPWTVADGPRRFDLSRVLTGRVVDAEGRAVAGAVVDVWRAGPGGSPVRTAADGTFRVEDVPDGRWSLLASRHGDPALRYASRAARTVDADARDVVLVLHPGADLVVRVEDPPADRLDAYLQDDSGAPEHARLRADAVDGVLRFHGVDLERPYTLWIRPGADGRSLLRREVLAGHGEVRVRREAGLTITGRLRLPVGARGVLVRASAGAATFLGGPLVDETVRVGADGRYEIPGLPPGTYRVEAWASVGPSDDATVRAEGSADGGGTLDLDLTGGR